MFPPRWQPPPPPPPPAPEPEPAPAAEQRPSSKQAASRPVSPGKGERTDLHPPVGREAPRPGRPASIPTPSGKGKGGAAAPPPAPPVEPPPPEPVAPRKQCPALALSGGWKRCTHARSFRPEAQIASDGSSTSCFPTAVPPPPPPPMEPPKDPEGLSLLLTLPLKSRPLKYLLHDIREQGIDDLEEYQERTTAVVGKWAEEQEIDLTETLDQNLRRLRSEPLLPLVLGPCLVWRLRCRLGRV